MTKPAASAPPADALQEARELLQRAWRVLDTSEPNLQITENIERFLAASAQVREVEACPYAKCDGSGYYAGRAEYGPCDCQLPKPAAEPVYGRNWCDYTAADDTPSKSRMNRIRLEQGEPVAVAQDSVDGVFRTMPDSATFEDYRDALAVGTLTAVDQMAFYNLLHDHLAEAEASLAACRADAERLDALRDNSWDLRCFDTFGGEDVGWKVMEHHQAEPLEREVAIVFTDDPRAAIDAARSQP